MTGKTSLFLMALLVGGAEFFGGLALVLGLLVRPVAAALAFATAVAIFTVHIDKGLFMANNGHEFARPAGHRCLADLHGRWAWFGRSRAGRATGLSGVVE